MARPIPLELPERDPREELLSRLEKAPAEHAAAILAGFEVLQGLHDRGVLELLRGVLDGGNKILEIVVEATKSPEAIRGIRNLVIMTKVVPWSCRSQERSEEHTSELQSLAYLVCRLLLEKKNMLFSTKSVTTELIRPSSLFG